MAKKTKLPHGLDKEAMIDKIIEDLSTADVPIRILVDDFTKLPRDRLVWQIEELRDSAADAGAYLDAYIWSRILGQVEEAEAKATSGQLPESMMPLRLGKPSELNDGPYSPFYSYVSETCARVLGDVRWDTFRNTMYRALQTSPRGLLNLGDELKGRDAL